MCSDRKDINFSHINGSANAKYVEMEMEVHVIIVRESYKGVENNIFGSKPYTESCDMYLREGHLPTPQIAAAYCHASLVRRSR